MAGVMAGSNSSLVAASASVAALLLRIDAFLEATGTAPTSLSRALFNDEKKLGLLRAGKDIYTETYDAADAALADLERTRSRVVCERAARPKRRRA